MSRLYAPVRTYASARSEIRDLDVIAFEGKGLISKAIRVLTMGSVTHVGVAIWWEGTLMLVESREFRGGRAVLLSSEIPPDGVLWLRPRPDLAASARASAAEWARGVCGAGYSYVGCLRFLRRLGIPTRKPAEDRETRGARFCSEMVSATYLRAGVDLRPDLPDSETSPAELVSSPYLELVARLMPVGAVATAAVASSNQEDAHQRPGGRLN